MDKKTAGIVGAISALAPLAATAAVEAKTIDDIMTPRSYAELLQPIPNAAALLKEMATKPAPAEPPVQTAQYYDPYSGGYAYGQPRRRWYHHHHHHHHWNGGWNGGYGYGQRRWHPHHHHHHHPHWGW